MIMKWLKVVMLALATAALTIDALKRHRRNYSKTRLKTNTGSEQNNYLSPTLLDEKEPCYTTPDKGIAGLTLFTINCAQLKSTNSDIVQYEYYLAQGAPVQATNGSTNVKRSCKDYPIFCHGVFLHRGTEIFENFILPRTSHLVVFAFNEIDISRVVIVKVKVTRINIVNGVNSMFTYLKNSLWANDMSRSVAVIAVISEINAFDRIPDSYPELFVAINHFSTEGCLSCTHQSALILSKVMSNYASVNNYSMESKSCLEISKQLLTIAKSMYNFARSLEGNDRPVVTEHINIIKTVFRKCIKRLSKQFHKDELEGNTQRHRLSHTSNVQDELRNVDNALMYYATLSILIPEFVLNDSEFKFNTHIHQLQKRMWQMPNEYERVKLNSPILSLTMMNMNRTRRKKIKTYNYFNNPIDLKFKLNVITKETTMDYTIQIPTNSSDKNILDRAVLVLKMDMKDISTLFVTISNMTDSLLFVWLRDTRPDIELMMNETFTTELPIKNEYKFKLNSLNENNDGMHYLGFYAKPKESTSTNDSATSNNGTSSVRFRISIFSPQCLYWDGIKWIPDNIEIGNATTNKEIHCRPKHLTMFSTTVLVVPDPVDPFSEISHPEGLHRNVFCLIMLGILYMVYFLLTLWAYYQDKIDYLRGGIHVLHDNYPGEDEVYLIKVYTGNVVGAGTTANVCIQINGSLASSRAHKLHSPDCSLLQRFSDDWFVVFYHEPLGEVQSIHLWHDNTGHDPEWYCKHVEVTEVRRNITWSITVERWFSLFREGEKVDHIIKVGGEYSWANQTRDNVELSLREEHLWTSIFTRHPRSWTTRCQRLAKTMCLILTVMVISFLYYELLELDEEKFLNFELTLRQLGIAFQTSIIQMLMTYAVSFSFKYNQNSVLSGNKLMFDVVHVLAPLKKKLMRNVVRLLTPKHPYMPAEIVNRKTKKFKFNFWLIIGWSICILIYIVSSTIIVAYGLKLGLVKSLHWLMTVVFTIIQSTIISQPLKIIIINFLTYKFRQPYQNYLKSYEITLDDYREKNNEILMKTYSYVTVIHNIRNTRTSILYSPLANQIEVQAFKEKQKLNSQRAKFQIGASFCLLLILIPLCCIFALKSFTIPSRAQYANTSHRAFIRNYLKTPNLDLQTLKVILSGKLIELLQIKEYYNGIPLDHNITMNSLDYERGWHGLYDCKIINAGIRLRQHRVKVTRDEWENYMDTDIYEEGWVRTTYKRPESAWQFRSLKSHLTFLNVDHSGYVLELTGGLSSWKKKLDEHLGNNWLDDRTQSIDIEFQVYTPNADFITMFILSFQTSAELLFKTSLTVLTVPLTSVFVYWNTYVFTLVFMLCFMYLTMRLLNSVTEDLTHNGTAALSDFWTIYDIVLTTFTIIMVFALALRWSLMEVSTKEYGKLTETAFENKMVEVCWMHFYVLHLASVTLAMALLRVFRLSVYTGSASTVGDMLTVLGGRIVVVPVYFALLGIGAWMYSAEVRITGSHEFFNVFVLGRNVFNGHPVLTVIMSLFTVLFFNATVIAYMIKYYSVLRMDGSLQHVRIKN